MLWREKYLLRIRQLINIFTHALSLSYLNKHDNSAYILMCYCVQVRLHLVIHFISAGHFLK